MIETAAVIVLWFYLLMFILISILFIADEHKKKTYLINPQTILPDVAVLIAARNEEENIGDCLAGVVDLDYPKDKLHVLVGNDESSDNTEQIINNYATKYNYIKQVVISEPKTGNAIAKANVLAQLIKLTQAPYVFVTDADIKVNPNWIKSMLPYLLNGNFGIVSATTVVQANSFMQKFQKLEWLAACCQIIGFDRLGIKTTAVGNNMAFTKQAYLSTGGYENIPYSVTEDFQLYKYIIKAGYKTINILHAQNVNITKAPANFITYLHQRKRWMIGASGLPLLFKTILCVYVMFFPLIIFLLCINPFLACIIWMLKVLVQAIVFLIAHVRIKQPINILNLLLFEFYTNVNSMLMLAFYLLPVKMVWKNRT